MHRSRNPIFSLSHSANVIRSGLYAGVHLLQLLFLLWFASLGTQACLEVVGLPGPNWTSKAAVQSGPASSLQGLLLFSKEETISRGLRGGGGRVLWVLIVDMQIKR